MFKETQKSAIIEAVIILTVSIVAVYNFGIYGVVVGTIVALLYRAVYLVVFANKRILSNNPIRTLRRWGSNVGVFMLILCLQGFLPNYEISTYLTFVGVTTVYSLCVFDICSD